MAHRGVGPIERHDLSTCSCSTTVTVARVAWAAAWSAAGATDDGEAVLADLLARYAEPHRAYHTLDHVRDCLAHVAAARHLLARPAEAELAVWFHDAIYDPRRGDNEERSARLAEGVLSAAGIEGETARRIGDLIRLTAHARDDLDGDAAVVCDADLAILGAEPARFDAYDAAIRREYDWVPEDVYRRERGRVLAGFLVRPRLYHTAHFRERFEARARENLRRSARSQASMNEPT